MYKKSFLHKNISISVVKSFKNLAKCLYALVEDFLICLTVFSKHFLIMLVLPLMALALEFSNLVD